MRNASVYSRVVAVVCFFLFAIFMVALDAALLFGSLALAALSWACFTLAYRASLQQHTTQAKRMLTLAIGLGIVALVGLVVAIA